MVRVRLRLPRFRRPACIRFDKVRTGDWSDDPAPPDRHAAPHLESRRRNVHVDGALMMRSEGQRRRQQHRARRTEFTLTLPYLHYCASRMRCQELIPCRPQPASLEHEHGHGHATADHLAVTRCVHAVQPSQGSSIDPVRGSIDIRWRQDREVDDPPAVARQYYAYILAASSGRAEEAWYQAPTWPCQKKSLGTHATPNDIACSLL